MDKIELENRLFIDKHGLDTELIEQASLFHSVSEACVTAIDERDWLKEELAKVEAREAIQVRADYDREGGKYTAAQVNQDVLDSDIYGEALQNYLDAKKECNSWQILKDSYEQRARMIGHLCRLYMADYYANPDVSDARASDDVKHKITRRVIGDARRSRKRS